MIGILLTRTPVERPPGDIGHPDTLPFPAIIETAGRPEDRLPLARSLVNKGAKAILIEHDTDPEPFKELSVPIYTSPLTLLPVLKYIPGKIAILSDKESAITPKWLQAYQSLTESPLIIAGMDDMPAFTEAYVMNARPVVPEAVSFEMNFVVQRIRKTNPDLGAIILASPYMSAYRKAVREAADLPVFDIVSLATFIHQSFS